MKFLHTADLHLGRRLNDIPLLEDQKAVLDQITKTAYAERVDAVIIAGDIYDKSMPGGDAMGVFDSFISGLAGNDISVFMISGNHDSGERISYFSELIRRAGIYTSDAFDGKLQTVKMEDEFGNLNIHLLPFIRPLQVRRFYPDEEINSYEDAVKVVLANSDVDHNERNILVCHQFITGGEVSDSEEFAVGGLDCISGSLFDDFDYVALGHLHKPQKVRRNEMRYAGSPLKYSISEAYHKKSVTIVEMGAAGDAPVISQVLLDALHDVREVKGTMQEVMAMEYSEDYVRVTVTDEMVPPDARVTVSTVFPNMITFAVANSKTAFDADIAADENIKDKSKIELFCDFYRLQNNDTEPDERQLKIMEEILKELEEEHYEAD